MTNQNLKLIKYLIGLILVALPSYLTRFSVFGVPTTALELAIYVLATYYVLLAVKKTTQWHSPDRLWLYPIGLFVIGAAIGVLISPDKRLALGQFKAFIFDPILFAFVLYSALRSKIVDRDWVVYLLLGLGLLLTWGAFWFPAHIGGRSLSFYWYEVNPNPNYLALMLTPLAAMAFSKANYWIWGLSGVTMAFALFTSGSRGAFVGVGLAILYILYKTYKKARAVVSILTVVALILTAYLARPDLSATPDSGRVSSSNNIRYEIWTTTKEILTPKGPLWGRNTQNFVFGVGLGNYQNYFTELTKDRVNYPEFIAPRALSPHNIFLAMWVNGGLLMLIGFGWLVFKALRGGHFLPAQAALVALIGHGLVDTPYFKNDLSVLLWVLLVLAFTDRE